jgi:aspartyl-tRNA(Asn)/glutamyl-tRNA(Gln) amidotransferase subunit C
MSKVVSIDEVKQVAHLARIDLSPEELALLAGQLGDILDYVRQLQAVAADHVQPTSHVLSLSNITRPDVQQPSMTSDAALSIAPARHNQFYKVPKVVDAAS